MSNNAKMQTAEEIVNCAIIWKRYCKQMADGAKGLYDEIREHCNMRFLKFLFSTIFKSKIKTH